MPSRPYSWRFRTSALEGDFQALGPGDETAQAFLPATAASRVGGTAR